MDKLDFEILKLLGENGRISHEEISKGINISRPAVHQRVKKLEDSGIIKKYKALIDWEELHQNIKSLIYIKINSRDFKAISQNIINIKVPDVFLEESYRLAGEWCMLVKVRASSPQNITNYIDEIWKINGVIETTTNFILSTIYEG